MNIIVSQSVKQKLDAAQDLLSSGQYSKAIALYSRVIFLERNNPTLYLKLASVYEQLRDYSTSISLLKKSYSLQNKEPTRQLISS